MTIFTTHDFPSPDVMRGRMALTAAIETSVLGASDEEVTHAEANGWYYSDGGGSWARLTELDGGLAVLTGIDRDYSETYRQQADLTLGLPDWVLPGLPQGESGEPGWLGFVVFFDGETWRSLDHGVQDGLEQILLPALSDKRTQAMAADWFDGAYNDLVGDDEEAPEEIDPDAVRRAAELGTNLTEEALFAILPFAGTKLAEGVTMAQSFARRPA